MRSLPCLALCGVGLLSWSAPGVAGGKKDDPQGPALNVDIVEYMMSFNKSKDGKLTKEELTDRRLYRVFDRADKDKHGYVTREEYDLQFADIFDQIVAWADGAPINVVNPEVLR